MIKYLVMLKLSQQVHLIAANCLPRVCVIFPGQPNTSRTPPYSRTAHRIRRSIACNFRSNACRLPLETAARWSSSFSLSLHSTSASRSSLIHRSSPCAPAVRRWLSFMEEEQKPHLTASLRPPSFLPPAVSDPETEPDPPQPVTHGHGVYINRKKVVKV